jgi:hypothetical protein
MYRFPESISEFGRQVIAGWARQRKIFPRPTSSTLLHSTTANIATLSLTDLRTAAATIAAFEETLTKEMASTLKSMKRIWQELQRMEALVSSIGNPDLTPPQLDLDAPPTDTFNLSVVT